MGSLPAAESADGAIESPFDGYDAVPVGLAVCDRSGTLLFVNDELSRLTGFSAKELVGRRLETLLPDRRGAVRITDQHNRIADPPSRLAASGHERLARRRDGSGFPVEVRMRPMDTSSDPLVVTSLIDVSERRRLESHFGLVVESAPYGMLLADSRGTITMANRKVCEMFGYTSDELIGQRVEVLLPERYRSEHVAQRKVFSDAPQQRQMGSGRDLTGLRKDGREFPVEVGLGSVQTPDGPMALAAIVDITWRKRAELDLREANAQLEEFTHVASHDLKSPVRGLANLIEWVREDLGDSPSEAVLRNLARMETRVDRMERLIDDLLSYARAGRRVTRVERISVPQLLQEIVELEPLPAGMRLHLDVGVDEIEGARTPLATALRNLYSNAIKHHDRPDGQVSIKVHEEGCHCVFSVIDDGPGIPEAAQERVFRLFQTLTAEQRNGTGLGLAVAKRLVENHGGRIELISRPNPRGCAFRVYWPRFMRSEFDV